MGELFDYYSILSENCLLRIQYTIHQERAVAEIRLVTTFALKEEQSHFLQLAHVDTE